MNKFYIILFLVLLILFIFSNKVEQFISIKELSNYKQSNSPLNNQLANTGINIINTINQIDTTTNTTTNKPYLWIFWEGFKPNYIKLCYESVIKQCSNSFNIINLNESNIHNYLPELNNYDLSKLIIQHKVDIYRIMLLYKFGGLYLDADIIVLKDLTDIIDKLKKYDFVGFGCNGFPCSQMYGAPSNWMLASRPRTQLMGNILKRQLDKISDKKQIKYHDIGKILIWEELHKLINEQNYKYYHYNPKYDGSRDINGNWVDSSVVFSNKKINYENEDDMLVFVFYNSEVSKDLKQMTREQLLNKDWNYSYFIKKALL